MWSSLGEPLCLPAGEVHPTLQGADPKADPTQSACEHAGTDRTDQPGHPWMGQLLLQGTRSQALQPTRPIDRAAHLVASPQALAVQAMEDAAGKQTLWRVGDCEPCYANTFYFATLLMRLCESLVREIRMPGLGGGRRPALRGVSSNPTL